jgi:alkaline phosphatase D
MASQDLDLVVHLGDYIYESSWGQRHVRKHTGAVPTTLPEFRARYALYKRDADLRAAHAALPWLITWDDHEVANDYANDISPVTRDPVRFLALRAAAYKAWYEHMPVPAAFRPNGPDARIYGRWAFGDLAEILMLDARQYRSHHACLPGPSTSTLVDCPERAAPSRTMLGAAQEAWLADSVRQSRTHWSVVAQSTLMAEADRKPGAEHGYWMDGWDGYAASRTRVIDVLATHAQRNALVVGGDMHAFYATDLRRDFADAMSPVVATEFVGGAITSQGASPATIANLLAKNPQLRYGRADKRGYGLLTLERAQCTVEFRMVDDEKVPSSAVRTLARFAVESGRPGVQASAT